MKIKIEYKCGKPERVRIVNANYKDKIDSILKDTYCNGVVCEECPFHCGFGCEDIDFGNIESWEFIERTVGIFEKEDLTGLKLISKERERQIEEKGWTEEHDDTHIKGELASEAMFYIDDNNIIKSVFNPDSGKKIGKTRIQQLTIAGALIVAEIERLLREEKRNKNI